MKTQNYLLTLLLLISLSSYGQKPYQKTGELEKVVQYVVETQDSIFVFKSQTPFTALVIKSETEETFFVQIEKEWISIPKDEDVDEPTYFISLPNLVDAITLSVPSNSVFDFFTIHSGEAPETTPINARVSDTFECLEPFEYITQSDWREGLQPPNYTRSFHTVNHNIVHHAAGSNSNSNYTQVVRDIYLYHTQVNGWSDLGYNYLIAQNGAIYAGRDPDGGSQDNVRGAHFCGSNSGTLGVSLLGNYETAIPTELTWNSLQSLLTFELMTQELDPFDSYSHPLGNIGTIAGHRDGCSTLCPGENAYSQLVELKNQVNDLIASCHSGSSLAFSVDRDFTKVNEHISFTSSGFYDDFKWVFEGGFPSESTNPSPSVTYSIPGIYDVTLIGMKGASADTLIKKDFIQVSTFPTQPLLFPNPVGANSELKIDSQDAIQKVELYEMSGKLTGSWNEQLEINIPEVKAGVYFLKIYAGSRIYNRKLIIEN
jgi:hypothetical protein